jgi:hypothetical protein
MEVREEFGAAVKRVLAEHNQSFRGQRTRTGLAHVTVMNMAQGIVPEMQTVVKFAAGFGLDVNEWLALAGYEPISSGGESEETAFFRAHLAKRRAIAEELGMEDQGQARDTGGAAMTPEEAEADLREWREFLLWKKARQERGE